MAVENTPSVTFKKYHTAPLILLLLAFAPAFAAFLIGKTSLLLVCLAIPFIFYLVTTPVYSFYLFIISIAVYYPYRLGGFALHPFDITMGLLFFSVVLDFCLHTRTEIRKTGLDLAFIFLIITTLLSAVFAYNVKQSLVPSLRIIVIYLAFRAIFKMALEAGIRKVVLFYIYLVFVLSLINCVLFIMHGGGVRIFGPSWLAFEIYTITALPMTLCFFIWAQSSGERFKFGFISLTIIAALLALQSRGSLLAVIITIPVLLLFAYWKIRRERNLAPMININKIAFIAVTVTIVFLVFNETLLAGFIDRVREMIESLARPKGTIALRLVLWKAAIKGFLTSPIVGIGIGNYIFIENIVPAVKTAPVWYYIRRMSSHNVLLQYLCETGVLGTLALLSVTFVSLKMGYRNFKRKLKPEDTQVSAALFMVIIVFAHSILYMRAWTWGQEGYLMAIIMGLNAAWYFHNRITSSS